jgi:hypothetical protein
MWRVLEELPETADEILEWGLQELPELTKSTA